MKRLKHFRENIRLQSLEFTKFVLYITPNFLNFQNIGIENINTLFFARHSNSILSTTMPTPCLGKIENFREIILLVHMGPITSF